METNQATETSTAEVPVEQQSPELQSVLLAIHSTEPVTVTADQQVVEFRRKKVAATDSYRAVAVQSYTLPEFDGSDANDSVFNLALREVFEAAASDILRAYCDESKAATTISSDKLAFSAVVAKMAEQQTSQRLNSDQIKVWYDASKTAADALARYTAVSAKKLSDKTPAEQVAYAVAVSTQLRDKYLSLASNNPGILPDLAVRMLGYISTEDTAHPVAKAVAKRLSKLQETSVNADDL